MCNVQPMQIDMQLLQLGADLNIKDREDHLPLDYASREINLDFVWLLIYSKFPTKVVAEKMKNVKDQRSEVKSHVDVGYFSLRILIIAFFGYYIIKQSIF